MERLDLDIEDDSYVLVRRIEALRAAGQAVETRSDPNVIPVSPDVKALCAGYFKALAERQVPLTPTT